jgi:hypothetical protein
MEVEMPAERVRGLLLRICWGCAVLPIGIVVVMHGICWPSAPPPWLQNAQSLLIVLTFLFLLAIPLIACRPARFGLATVTFLVALSWALVTCNLLSVNLLPAWLDRDRRNDEAREARLRAARRRAKPIGIYTFDDYLGYGHLPRSKGVHEYGESRFIYSIDDRGCRVTPTPAVPQGTVIFTGCSFTFGYGVQDSECYPTILAREHWAEYKIQNHAVCGYGTAHAYLQITRELNREPSRLPSLVLYAVIPNHVQRNYLRPSWVSHITGGRFLRGDPAHRGTARRSVPHFELKDGELVSMGLIGEDFELPDLDSPALWYAEAALTEAFLQQMRQMCLKKQTPFVVLLLPEAHALPECDTLVRNLVSKHSLLHLDLSGIDLRTGPDGIHPNATTHRRFAEAIAQSFVTDLLRTRTAIRPPHR